ncbi:uncharacterized protein GGS22DRAFT_183421 [Annulohypoxylon maeteangense]|uniref:uncharacterized protein n=1 Tax=Annulohypoxylon maeteangense TaxID=1927788 RepID=UPI0020076985|nr:uncharacterized protein GGS22DRAFT_183421 [Annulohypoxylon maeteangense]KAI0890070.1 hypothetical protein GGS22DRAFT_183421 [Annulohypoxylon maeteangense]
MGVWGPGLMQCDDDYEIAKDLSEMCGCQLLFEGAGQHEKKEDTIRTLNGGVFSKKFDRIFSANSRPLTSHHRRERLLIIFAMLAMRLGVRIESDHLRHLHLLRPWLPTMEQQLQLFTAVEEYKNDGTPWITGSKNLAEMQTSKANPGLVDPFWYSGLGHSADENPTAEMSSKSCLSCRDSEPRLRCCLRCKMARYCSKKCQRHDWQVHKRVCEVHENPRVSSTKEELTTPVTNTM